MITNRWRIARDNHQCAIIIFYQPPFERHTYDPSPTWSILRGRASCRDESYQWGRWPPVWGGGWRLDSRLGWLKFAAGPNPQSNKPPKNNGKRCVLMRWDQVSRHCNTAKTHLYFMTHPSTLRISGPRNNINVARSLTPVSINELHISQLKNFLDDSWEYPMKSGICRGWWDMSASIRNTKFPLQAFKPST